jgi:quercetin dioxygenase-like cupin family protein
MADHQLPTAIVPRDSGERFGGFGGDAGEIRVATDGEDPVAVVELTSEDREWTPRHSHPWDELTYVLEGSMEFEVGEQRGVGRAGALVSLPHGVPHALRVPEGRARYLMITLGAPSVGFLREVGHAYAEGPTLERIVEIARRHGVQPSFDR